MALEETAARAARRRRGAPFLAGLFAAVAGVSAAAGARFTPAAGNDDWKAEANTRIEQIRKRDIGLFVADRYGNPVPGASASVVQARHYFALGSCINTNALNNASYAAFFKSHFEWAVLENESKWLYNEPQRDFENYSNADALVSFCEQNGILMRGHNIFWAKEEYTPFWCRSLPDSELRSEVEERLASVVPRFRGKFLHWDVNNEMLDGDFFRRRLGSDIEPYMFRRTKELDPAVLTFVNDYSIIAGSESRTAAYMDEILSLEARDGPVDRIGVQGHFWGDTVEPIQVLARLDQLSALQKHVWVTEYDAVDADENGRADKLENLYRSAFSHPIVDGILMWGFWAGSHWRGANAAIVNLDWTLNAAGRRLEALMAEWTTAASGTTGPAGSFPLRGFHGTYDVTVTSGMTTITESFEAPPGKGPAAWMVPLKRGACFAAAEVDQVEAAADPTTGETVLSWNMIPGRNDMTSVYDVLRSTSPSNFSGAVCLETNGADTIAMDAAQPAAGGLFSYLIRGKYGCPRGEGPLGSGSNGTPRTGPVCH